MCSFSVCLCRKEHTLLKMQAFSCQLSNIEPNNSEAQCLVVINNYICLHSPPLLSSLSLASVADGMLVLQALVEGTVLEVHVIVNEKEADPLVELYIPSHYGSGVCANVLFIVTAVFY